MSEAFEVVVTRDGAHAMRDRDSGELMHPVGPRTEAEVLYVAPSRLAARLAQDPGRDRRRLERDAGSGGHVIRTRDGPITLFDVGLGAGSNAAAAWRTSEARAAGERLEIISFDRTDQALALALQPDHAAQFGFDDATAEAARAVLDGGRHDTERTTWRLILGDLPETLAAAEARADVVFWDPYSTKTNPELWGVTALSALRAVCADRATVHTYAAATSIRAAFILAGFAVGYGPAIGTKTQTTAAAVERADLDAPLDARWQARFQRSSARLPPDAPPDAEDRVAAYFDSKA